ncbi:hypothetical protein Ab1vBOLIVR2_gp97c [Agrobacterium phage OLIVR2]|nr:hypothetical protein Ab1vBOLIVR2_gp97c [Agrobacterium phage OLIVR2]
MIKSVITLIMISVLPFLVVSCQSLGSVSNPCSILRKPPTLQSETKTAVFKDKPFLHWFAKVNEDGKARKCW